MAQNLALLSPFRPPLLQLTVVEAGELVDIASITAAYDDGAGQSGTVTIDRIEWTPEYWNPMEAATADNPQPWLSSAPVYFPEGKFCAVRWIYGGDGGVNAGSSGCCLIGGGFTGSTGTTFIPNWTMPFFSERPDSAQVEGPNPNLIAHALYSNSYLAVGDGYELNPQGGGFVPLYPNLSGDPPYGSYAGHLCMVIQTDGVGGPSNVGVFGDFGFINGHVWNPGVIWRAFGDYGGSGNPYPRLEVPIYPHTLRKRNRPRASGPTLSDCWAAPGSRMAYCADTDGMTVGMVLGVADQPQVAHIMDGATFILSRPSPYLPATEEAATSVGCDAGDIEPGSGDDDLDIGGVLLDGDSNPTPVTVTVS